MIPAAIFCTVLLTYLVTAAPTISFFDSGELIAGAYTLGIGHPPGYPVYITIGKLFTLMPFGNIAYRMNLMSGFFAAMSSVMVYYITRAMLDEPPGKRELPGLASPRLGVPEVAGIFAALAFGLSYTLWAWAVVSKFYTLNAFVATCIVMLLIRWKRARRDYSSSPGHSLAYLYLISFICGIAGAVHISQFVLIPAYLMYIALVDRRTFIDERPVKGRGASAADYARGVQLRTMLIMAFFFALGHSVFLHLPLRAMQEPLINWGGSVNWEQFKWTYNREGYQSVGGERSLGLFMAQLKSFDMVREFGWAGIPLILGGALVHFRKDWRNAALLVGGSALLTFAVVYGGNPPKENIFLLEQFYIPVYIFLAVLMGGSMYFMLRMRALAPALIGLTLPFIFLGDIPAGGAKAAGEGLRSMLHSIPYLYAGAYLLAAAAIGGGAWALMRGRLSKKPLAYTALVLVVFLLYPAYQLRAHYWKNDRSRNFLAYDMGNSELNFAPEFAVLFTWGDSGAFPMWYLQIAEHKRPDVLLVHTPHLPLDWFLFSIKRTPAELGDPRQIADDYGLIRNYNGIKGVEQILKIPPAYREPGYVIRELIKHNPERAFAFDYSSRYSIDMPFVVQPYGILYVKPGEGFVEANMNAWRFMVTRGLPAPVISLDLDDGKAVKIYGFVHADLGKYYLSAGLKPLAEQEFVEAVKFTPELWNSLARYMN